MTAESADIGFTVRYPLFFFIFDFLHAEKVCTVLRTPLLHNSYSIVTT